MAWTRPLHPFHFVNWTVSADVSGQPDTVVLVTRQIFKKNHLISWSIFQEQVFEEIYYHFFFFFPKGCSLTPHTLIDYFWWRLNTRFLSGLLFVSVWPVLYISTQIHVLTYFRVFFYEGPPGIGSHFLCCQSQCLSQIAIQSLSSHVSITLRVSLPVTLTVCTGSPEPLKP